MIPRGETSLIRHVFILDSSSTTGAGKTGLAYDTAGWKVRYIYPGGTPVAVTLENITTLGTYQAPTSNAHMRFREVDATNMPGWYEVHFHNDWASTANGRKKISLAMSGPSGMAPLNVSIDLIGFNLQSIWPGVSVQEIDSVPAEDIVNGVWASTNRTLTSFGSLVSDVASAVWSAGTRTLTSFGSLVSDIWSAATRTLTSIADSAGVTTLLSRVVGTIASGTHQPQSGDAYARIGANGAGLTSLGDTRLANLDATVSSRLASASYTAPNNADISAIKVKTDNLPPAPAAVGSQMDLVSLPNATAIQAFASAIGNSLKKGVAVTIPFVMTDSTSHAPVTGKTVTVQVSKDGGTFAASTNAAAEVGSGVYKVGLTATETNATSVTLRCTATSCDDQIIVFFTQS